MVVVDASCLAEVVAETSRAHLISRRLEAEGDLLAPSVIDVEVLGMIRRRHLAGALDLTAATLAVHSLRNWPGERFHHRAFLDRAWELRASVRGWDAMYVALAEVTGSTLLTLDARLAAATGPTCRIEVVG
ncbi:MAG: type II toxin-antitoxin system VapC family toxin [Acidimicrobiales bacterium]